MREITSARVLVVDDEMAQMKALCDTLSDHGYLTTGFTSPNEALTALRSQQFDLLLTDLMMSEMDGIDLLRAALQMDTNLVSVMMTGHGTIDSAVEAMKAGALDYILKPFKLREILPVLSRALAMRQLRIENAALQRRVNEHATELEAMNKELEAFSYSVSHDLRAPVRQIGGFSQLVLEDKANLSERNQRYLRIISDVAKEMGGLIDGLLEFSRLGRQSLSKQAVAMTQLVRQVIAEQQREQGERQMELHVGEIPDCVADPILLKQVFTNLLSNAFKYTRGKEKSVIEVGCRELKGERIYYVRDNGAGFDMQYVHKLFGVFQRLHNSEEFEGTGVGLSIVQRIIHRHGGRIWADSAVGKGATFYFTLPS